LDKGNMLFTHIMSDQFDDIGPGQYNFFCHSFRLLLFFFVLSKRQTEVAVNVSSRTQSLADKRSKHGTPV